MQNYNSVDNSQVLLKAWNACLCRKKQKDQKIKEKLEKSKEQEKLEIKQKKTSTSRREIEAEELFEEWLEHKVNMLTSELLSVALRVEWVKPTGTNQQLLVASAS